MKYFVIHGEVDEAKDGFGVRQVGFDDDETEEEGSDDEETYSQAVDEYEFFLEFDIYRDRPLLNDWPRDLVFPASKDWNRRDVLFHTGTLFFSQRVRDVIEPLAGNSAEWLPVTLQGLGIHYVLHPLKFVELGPNALTERTSVTKDVFRIKKHDFDPTLKLPPCFLIRQPVGAPSRRAGCCIRNIIVNDRIRWKFAPFRGIDFALACERPE
jgi:hypothetical protein